MFQVTFLFKDVFVFIYKEEELIERPLLNALKTNLTKIN